MKGCDKNGQNQTDEDDTAAAAQIDNGNGSGPTALTDPSLDEGNNGHPAG